MSEIAAALCGALVGLGVVTIRSSRSERLRPSKKNLRPEQLKIIRPLALGLAAGTIMYLATNWALASVGFAAMSSVGILVSGGTKVSRNDEIIAEAVALWAEQLRDTLAAAHGLQQTIMATAPHAPEVLKKAVEHLAADLPYGSVSSSLYQFADEVNHPSADFVVAALVAATEHEARDVGMLLGHLALCSREEAKMHQRVWVSRARTRTAVRIIMTTVVGFVSALFVLNRQYLAPYGTTSGQLILCAILSTFVIAMVLLQHGARIPLPDRFIASKNSEHPVHGGVKS
ncbi:hypothetical protein HQ459_06215 [bacterium]|nr:hypothetical protein [bacterium]